LCGIYSIINATRTLRSPFTLDQCETLFSKLVNAFDQRWGFQMAILEGINSHQLSYLIKSTVTRQYGLVSFKPFHSKPDTSQTTHWAHIDQWVNSGGCTIIGTYEHWTVIHRVTAKTLHLVDSGCMRQLRQQPIVSNPEYHHRPYPNYSYFLKREEDV
jgi:hypothetical protein